MKLDRRLCLICVLLFVGCGPPQWQHRQWEDIKRTGEIVLLTRNSGVSYFSGKDGEEQGYEFEIVRAFAKHINVALRVVVAPKLEDAFRELREGRADLIAAGLFGSEETYKDFVVSRGYDRVSQQIVCRKDVGLKKLSDLEGRTLMVAKTSGFEGALRDVETRVPGVKSYLSSDASSEQILQLIWEGGPNCTIADSQSVQMSRSFMPELSEVLNFGADRERVLVLGPNHRKLNSVFADWLALPTTQKLLKELQKNYFRSALKSDYFDQKIFNNRLSSRLPKFIDIFRRAGDENSVPWELLAAMAYQESHWEETAESSTGVQGIMMLTKQTAKDLGIQDRTSAEESIQGGAKFFAGLVRRLPKFLRLPDKYWFALAAYNVGYGHLQDARRIAIDLNLDPNGWDDVQKSLPLLSLEKHFRETRYGYARGTEPVVYVRRVRGYWDLLKKKKFPKESS